MKVTTIETKRNEYGEGERYELEIMSGGKNISMSAGRGEPEDNSLSRDLNFVYQIPEMLKLAYEAGKNGEEFEIDSKIQPTDLK